jgi:hypothetical protein
MPLIQKKFPNLLAAYRGITEDLAYNQEVKPLKWGVCIGYPEVIGIEIEDALHDENMTIGMASYTKSRWTRFLRRYFRDDFSEWIDAAVLKLQRYPSRPFVASYSVNLNTGHNYGGCLASLQIRICPRAEVILTSRACHLDKVGFLDLSLINVVARRMKYPKVRASWLISNCYISAISQIFYVKMFNMPMRGHRLEKTLHRLTDVGYDDIKFGPLKRGRRRMMDLESHGYVVNSIKVKDLSIAPVKFLERTKPVSIITAQDAEDWMEEHGLD